MKVKKKLKEKFKEFRNNEKTAYKTFKIPLKTILLNRDTTQQVIDHLVFEMNDLVIHTYQFIRLYVLHQYTNNNPLPELDDTFILYCIKTFENMPDKSLVPGGVSDYHNTKMFNEVTNGGKRKNKKRKSKKVKKNLRKLTRRN
jgi:hypothetical protein